MSTSDTTASAGEIRPRLRWGIPAYVLVVLAAMALAIVVPKTGYVLNISLQATTYAIAVLGLTVVLGLCGQINLAQAAFFGLGAYAVGIGQTEHGLNF
jgi:branched-chain amino acid transport system permease protein